jgi:hypothetical protein
METIRRYSTFIGGDWVDADERFEIRSPGLSGRLDRRAYALLLGTPPE